jgi:hypothetical protein
MALARTRGARIRLTLLLILAALVVFRAPAQVSAQGLVETTCPATFEVLHDDRIGPLALTAGPYTITLLNAGTLSCAEASDLFRQFLEDWDGRLPRPWVLDAATGTFRRGTTSTGFRVAKASSPSGGGGGGQHGALACPSYFTVLHDDHIGDFDIPEGRYRITLLSAGRISCSQASSLFAKFLQDFDGILPSPWFLDEETGSFIRGGRNVGFRIKPLSGPPPPPDGSAPSGNRCGGTFRVLHNDRIGKLRLPAGPYVITILKGSTLSCQSASQLFRQFLGAVNGVLPSPWVVNVTTATFTRGRGAATGFRVKPAS